MQRDLNGGVTSTGRSSEALGNANEVVAPQIVQQHPLSLEGRGVHPFDKAWKDGYWGLPEALAWIATRDLGIVAGVIARLKDGRVSDAEKIDAFLALVNAYPHYEPSDLDDIPADEALRYALHQQQLVVKADWAEEPEASHPKIKEFVWVHGEFRFSENGSWWSPDPDLRPTWINFRFNRVDLLRVFQPSYYEKKPPRAHGHWIDALEALTWKTYGHSFTWAEFRTDLQAGRQLSPEHHLLCMEPNWQALVRRFDPVDFPLRVRPLCKRDKQKEQILKFKFSVHEADLVWLMDGSGLPFDLVAKIKIPAFDERSSSQIEELHYLHFLRAELGQPYGDYAIAPPDPATQRRSKLATDHHKVRRKLEYILRSNPPRSIAKSAIQASLELTDTGFRKLWDKVAPDFPEWREGGAPKKSSPPK